MKSECDVNGSILVDHLERCKETDFTEVSSGGCEYIVGCRNHL